MAIPVGQYVARQNTTTGFSTFNVGDSLIVQDSQANDGIYTINAITDDGTHSYMGLTGPPLTEENVAGSDTAITLLGVGKSGDKLIALGDEDSGSVNIWSYNSSTDDDSGSGSGTIIESGKPGVDIGTSGWSANAITPVLDGSTSQFVFTAGQSALRVCDGNDANTTMVKHFKFYETTQFRSAGSKATTYGRGTFAGWQEHSNFLAKPSSGWFLGGGGEDDASNNDIPSVNDSKLFGFSRVSLHAEGGEQTLSVDTHLARSLNSVSRTNYPRGSYKASESAKCKLKSSEVKDPPATQTYLKLTQSSIGKIPMGAVIGLADLSGRIDQGVTFTSERMLVRNVEIENSRIFVYRGYGTSTAATIDISAYPSILQYGCGFNWTCQWTHIGSGFYMSGDYEFASSFIYDGNQESLLRTSEDLLAEATKTTFTIPEGKDFARLKLHVAAWGPYPARVTGGRIYIREKDAEDDWHLLVDIDLVKGVRPGTTANYGSWNINAPGTDAESGSTIEEWTNVSSIGQIPKDCFHSKRAVRSLRTSMETYQAINNFYPDIRRNSIGYLGESYKCSSVGGERAWYGNVKLREENGVINRYGDRVMYSEYRKFDTIPGLNYINAAEGDSDDIVELKYFSEKLFIFKTHSLHIWDVRHGEPSQWFPDQTIRKTGGVEHPCSVVSTSYGIVWANAHGCFYHDGRKIENLIEGKIRDTESPYHSNPRARSWSTFVTAEDEKIKPMVMFAPKEKQLYVLKDPTGTSSGNTERCYIYNFISKSWVFNDGIFTDTFTDAGSTQISVVRAYTNPIIDWNNNVVLAYTQSIDTGFNLGSAFTDNDVDIITSAEGSVNINFTGSDDAADWKWANYNSAATFTKDTANNRLISAHTGGGGANEGVVLVNAYMNTRIAGVVYRIILELEHAGSTGDALEEAMFFVDFCGTVVELGTITHVATRYTLDVECTDDDGDFRIYHADNIGTNWYVTYASVKEIGIDLDGDADTKLVSGDRLKIEAEKFLVIGTNTDIHKDKITVIPGYDGSTAAAHSSGVDVYKYSAVFQQISPASVATAAPAFITKDFDFDEPGRVKKIYKIYITYMNSPDVTLANKIKVAADGFTTFNQTSIATPHSGSTFALTGTFAAEVTSWDVAVFTFDAPFPCQSIALYFNDGAVVNGLSINDITFEYRIIHKRIS